MLCAAFALSLASSLAASDVPVFRWVDKRGDLHVTDRLGDVPEPYYSMYAAEVARRKKSKNKRKPSVPRSAPAPRSSPRVAPGGPITAAPPAQGSEGGGSSVVDQEIARQKYWQDLVARWRKSLAAATRELATVDRELAQARLNPLLRTTPQVKAQIQTLENRRAGILEKLERARKMLLETIPARARAEQVPPKWLM